mgnify:CR=1 FL=1
MVFCKVWHDLLSVHVLRVQHCRQHSSVLSHGCLGLPCGCCWNCSTRTTQPCARQGGGQSVCFPGKSGWGLQAKRLLH